MQRSGFLRQRWTVTADLMWCAVLSVWTYTWFSSVLHFHPLPPHTAEDSGQCVASRQPRHVCFSLHGDSDCAKIFAMQPVMLCALRWRPQHGINNSTEFPLTSFTSRITITDVFWVLCWSELTKDRRRRWRQQQRLQEWRKKICTGNDWACRHCEW